MKIPVTLKLVVLMVGATAFYGYVGQLVPQKEVHPPEVVELAEDLSPAEMAEIGQQIFVGKGICSTCHTIGQSGALRFPDLDGIATRAATRIPGLSALDYLAQSLYDPEAYIVEGFNPGMPAIDKPPVGLTEGEILTVLAYLQSLGGTPTLTPSSRLAWLDGGGEAAGEAGEAGEAPAEAGATTALAATVDTVSSGDPVAAGSGDPLAVAGCTQCHRVDSAERLEASSLYDAGARYDRQQLVYKVAFHETNDGAAPLPQLTIDELHALVERLTALRGAAG